MPDYFDPNAINFAANPMAGFQLPSYSTPSVAVPSGTPASPSGSLMSSFNSWLKDTGIVGTTNADGVTQQGWGGLALGAGQGIFNGWLGMQQLQLAKDTFGENKRQFQLNFDAQKQSLNTRLEDRQRARVASNAGAYQSVGDYMQQNRI